MSSLQPYLLLATISLFGFTSSRALSSQTLYPNEPPGFVEFARNEWQDLPLTNFPSPGGRSGAWYAIGRAGEAKRDANFKYHVGGLQIAEDASAPASPPSVVRMRFPRGFRAGRGPVQWGGWDLESAQSGGHKEKVYLSLWIKFEGRDFENQITGMKMGYLQSGGGVGANAREAIQILFFLKGNGKQVPMDRFWLEVHAARPTTASRTVRFLPQNIVRRAVMTVGMWHHLEAVAELNDLGQQNGRLKWWVDGQLILSYDDLIYRLPQSPGGFYMYKFHPVWGGGQGTKTRDDFISVDDVYISGLPLVR